jgi:hypothetical protein
MTDTTTSAPDAAQTAAPTPKPEDLNPLAVQTGGDEEDGIWAEMEAEDAGASPPEDNRDRDTFENEGSSDEKQPAASAAPDPWASAPEELRQEREALLADKQKLEHRVKTEAGRVAASQRRIAELQKLIQSPAQQGRDVDPTEKLKALAEDYPEVAGPVTEALSLLSGQVSELTATEASRREAAKQELHDLVSAEEAAVAAAHPGWEQFLQENGNTFMSWIEDQPRALREAFIRNQSTITDGQAAIDVIGAFKRHINPQAEPAQQQQPPNTRRERQLAGSASPTGGSRAPVRSGIPDIADEQAIWDAMEEQEMAQQRR